MKILHCLNFILLLILFSAIFIFGISISSYICYAQENEQGTNNPGQTGTTDTQTTGQSGQNNTTDTQNQTNIDQKLESLKKSFDSQEQANNVPGAQAQGLPIFRTIIVFIVILILFFVIQYYLKRNQKNLLANNQLGTIIYKEPVDKGIWIGVMKVLEHYYLVSLSNQINILSEITEKEEIDSVLLIKSKAKPPINNFFDLFKGGINTKSGLNKTTNINALKEKLKSFNRRDNG